jgi:hypothetical protein
MARPSIEQVRASSDHATLFRWNLIFAAFPAALAGAPDSEDLNIRCESTEQPSRIGQTIINNIRGHQTKQTGIWTYNPITLSFVETTDNIVNQFIHDWVDLTWVTKTGVSATKEESQATIILQRLDNADEPIVEFKLVGALPEAEDKGGTLDGATSDFIKPTLTLNFDYFERTAVG